jgi:hypothetical protein
MGGMWSWKKRLNWLHNRKQSYQARRSLKRSSALLLFRIVSVRVEMVLDHDSILPWCFLFDDPMHLISNLNLDLSISELDLP